MSGLYRRLDTVRAQILNPNEWVPLDLPVGAIDALVQLEDLEVAFRVTSDNTLDPSTEGNPCAMGIGVTFAGTTTEVVRVYISAAAPATAVALFQRSP